MKYWVTKFEIHKQRVLVDDEKATSPEEALPKEPKKALAFRHRDEFGMFFLVKYNTCKSSPWRWG